MLNLSVIDVQLYGWNICIVKIGIIWWVVKFLNILVKREALLIKLCQNYPDLHHRVKTLHKSFEFKGIWQKMDSDGLVFILRQMSIQKSSLDTF